jgi:hypothetical protein
MAQSLDSRPEAGGPCRTGRPERRVGLADSDVGVHQLGQGMGATTASWLTARH